LNFGRFENFKLYIVNVPIEALGVYFSMGPIGWASNGASAWAPIRAWASIFHWVSWVSGAWAPIRVWAPIFSLPLIECASNRAWASIEAGLLLETIRYVFNIYLFPPFTASM